MPHDLARDGIIAALTPAPHTALTLRHVLAAKRARGDLDAERFRLIATFDFAHRLEATVEGAAWAMRQWIAKADRLGWSEGKKAERVAFLADLDAVLAGDLTGRDVAKAEAA